MFLEQRPNLALSKKMDMLNYTEEIAIGYEENGVFVTSSPPGIRGGVNQITEKEFNPEEIQKHAQKFDKKIFADRLK